MPPIGASLDVSRPRGGCQLAQKPFGGDGAQPVSAGDRVGWTCWLIGTTSRGRQSGTIPPARGADAWGQEAVSSSHKV